MPDDQPAPAPDDTPPADQPLPSAWFDALPDPLKDAPFLKPNKDGQIRSPDEVAAALVNAGKLQANLAESHIKIPSHDAADTDIQSARERALKAIPGLREEKEGEDTPAPKSADDYKIPQIEDFDADAANLPDIAAFAHEHGWGQQQFSDYVEKVAAGQKATREGQSDWVQAQQAAIREKLGLAKDERLARTMAALQDFAPEGFIESMGAGKLDAGVVLMLDKLVHKMVEMGDESSQFVQQANAGAKVMTPEEHGERSRELWQKLQEMNESHPEYNRLNVKRMEHIRLSRSH